MASFCSSNDKRNFQWITVASVELIKLPLIDILASYIKPVDLYQKITSCSTLKLRPDQRKICLIQPPDIPDYNIFDVTLLYKLIRNLLVCCLPFPAQGWGFEPKTTDIQISDDIERLRLFRNNYHAHAKSASVPDIEFEDVWRNLKFVIKRIACNSNIICNTDYEKELRDIERSICTEYQLETCRILLEAHAGLQKQTDSKDEPDISIIGENEKKCGETALFEANVEMVKSSSWSITWQKRRGEVRKHIDTSKEKYSGSTKRKLVIKSVCKEDDGEYQAVLSFGSNGPDYRSKNTIRLSVLEDFLSVKIFVNSPVCFGSKTIIKSEVSSTTTSEKIEWQKSKDGIVFHCIKEPILFRTTARLECPSYVIPKTTFTDKLYYRLLVWNENGEGVSNTVYLDVTGNPPNIMTSFKTNIKDRSVKLVGNLYVYDDSPGILETFWTKNEKKINPEESGWKFSEICNENPSLTISNVSPDDAGEYRLTATNAVGSSTSDVIVLGYPIIFLEKIEDKNNGRHSLTVMIESLPAPYHVQWSSKNKDDEHYTPIDINTEEYEGTTVSFPHPVLVVRQKGQLEKNSFKIEVTNFIGKTVHEISGENNPVVLRSTDNVKDTPYNDHGASVRFTRLNNILADEFPLEKVEKLKFLLKTSNKVKNRRSVLEATSAMDFLTILQDEQLFTQTDVIFMQFLCRETECLKLNDKCIEYAEKQKALCFFEKPSVNGCVDVQFHVQGDISGYTKEFVREVIETVAAILDCKEEDIHLNAVRYSTSFFLSLSIKKVYIRKLLALKEQDRLKLKNLNIDYLKIDEETIYLNVGEDNKMECRIRKNSNADVDEIETEQALRDENNCKSKVEEIDSEEELLSDLEQMDLMSDDEDEPVNDQDYFEKRITMNIWDIATTLRTNVSFLWSFISQQPTEMTLGAIVGWIIGWNLFYLEKIHFIYLVVMVIVIVLSIFLIWYFGDFIWIKIKDILFLFIPFLFCICAILMSALLVFGEAVLIFLVVTGAVSLVSLAMVYGFDNIRLVISNAILDQLRNFFLSLIGTFFLSGFAVWGATFMPLLIGKSVFFYLASVAVAYLIVTNMNINGPGSREEIELDGLPPPSPETLSESRQQEVDGQFANPHGQASEEITLGTGHIQDENHSFREQPPTAPATFQLVPVRTEQEQPQPPVANPTGPCHLKPGLDQIDRQVLQSVDEHATQIVTNMNINGPGSRDEIELDGLPPPSPETLSESRQQEVDGQFANPHGQASEEITLGIGHIQDENRSFREQPPTAPSTFHLVSVRIEQEQPPPPVANPTGPGHLKPSLDQIDRQVLQSVDEHATQVSTYQHPSFRELIWNLVFSKNISNELEIVRAIFKWLSTKNLKDIVFNNVGKGSPEEVLLDLKEGKTTYAKVFDTLCNYAGVHSRIICGYAKGVNYKPGMKFHPDKDKHTWNVVYINGNWGLVDADWAARIIIEKQWKYKYQLNEHFFLPDPNHFIYDHFPDDDRWQLLDKPITLEEFENKPHIKPEFFTYGLEIVSHNSVIIYGRGEVNVRLRYPALKQKLDFDFILQFESGEEEEYKGTKLNRYGMQESVEGIASFRLRIPVKGSYIFSIYAKEYTPENKVNVYSKVCGYKIIQEEVSLTEPHPFPPCAYLNWGPSSYFYRYGLATNQQTAQILIRDGKAELKIIIPNQMQFMTTLKHNDQNDEDLQGYATHRIVGNTVYFNITAPSRGEYGLEIHANDPATESSTLYQVAQYLVECNEDVQTVPLPKMSAGYLGAKPKFNDYGLDTLSHHIPVIHLEANTVEIQFSVTQDIRVNAKLIEVESDRETPKFVFIQTKDSVVSFIVNCPSVGFYKLQLYAIPVHNPSQQLTGVYNYLINCQRKTDNVFPFPIQYTKWTEGCYMWEPLIVHKEIEKPTVNFHVKIPKAKAVAVEVNQKWTQLQSLMPEIWQGEVNLAPYYGEGVKVNLNAFFGGDNTSYSTLLEYFI